MKIWRKRIGDLISELINDGGVCRAAPAIPGLLNISNVLLEVLILEDSI